MAQRTSFAKILLEGDWASFAASHPQKVRTLINGEIGRTQEGVAVITMLESTHFCRRHQIHPRLRTELILVMTHRDNQIMASKEDRQMYFVPMNNLFIRRATKMKLFMTVFAVFAFLSIRGLDAQAVITAHNTDNGILGTAAGTGTAGTGATLYGPTPTGTTLQIGRVSATQAGEFLEVFQLPTLPPGQSIATATLSFQITASATLGANIDLYGLPYSTSPTVTTAQYYVGSNDATATTIQSALFPAGVAITAGAYSTSGSGNLASYLNAQYATGAVGGNYAFLRFNENAFNTAARFYIATAENTTAGYAPTITYTTYNSGAIINVKSSPYNAKGDGSTNDLPAFVAALAVLTPGQTLLVPPGIYNLVLNGTTLTVPAGVTILGEQNQTTLLLTTNGGAAYRELFRPGGSNIILDGLTIQRGADFPVVMIPIMGVNLTNFTIQNCTIDGNRDVYTTNYCDATEVGSNIASNILIQGTTISYCNYGLFEPSTATGTVNGLTVQNCHFNNNYASDLEFNAPAGTVNNVTVTDCYFRNNQCTSTGAGWATGFANIHTATVSNCYINSYTTGGIHIEANSSNVTLSGNTLIGVTNNPILVISGTNGVTIDHNTIDARNNPTANFLINATAGGGGFANPTNVAVSNNILVDSNTTGTWYLQPGSYATAPTGNIVVAPNANIHLP